MLGKYYRFQIKNSSGLQITAANCIISFIPWKLASDGSITYGAEVVLNPSGAIANGAVGNTAAQDNSASKNIGLAAGHFQCKTDAGALGSNPQFILYLQESPDNAKWPDDEEGVVLAAPVVTTAATDEKRGFEV